MFKYIFWTEFSLLLRFYYTVTLRECQKMCKIHSYTAIWNQSLTDPICEAVRRRPTLLGVLAETHPAKTASATLAEILITYFLMLHLAYNQFCYCHLAKNFSPKPNADNWAKN